MPPTASSSEKPPRPSAGSGVHTFLDHFYLVSNWSRRHFHRENMYLCNTSTKLIICNMQFRHIAQKIDASGKCQWHIKKSCTSSPDRWIAFICCIYFVLFVLEYFKYFKWCRFPLLLPVELWSSSSISYLLLPEVLSASAWLHPCNSEVPHWWLALGTQAHGKTPLFQAG